MGACYGVTTPAASVTEIRQKLWAQKIGETPAPKLCNLPPTTEAFEQNVLRAQYQIAQQYNGLDSDPSNLNVLNFGWAVDYTNKSLITWWIEYHMLRKTFWSWSGVAVHQINYAEVTIVDVQPACTILCTCGGESGCCNRSNIKQHANDNNDNDIFNWKGLVLC